MLKIGQLNTLTVVKEVPFGIYLDGYDWGEILLPNKVVPADTKLHDRLDVFIYFDSEDKIIATTLHPRIQLGACALLKVIDVNRVGAFLDWGLDKDLLVPRPEQQRPMELGKSYLVYLKLDHQERLVASSKLDFFLDTLPKSYQQDDEVSILVADNSPLGTKVIINGQHWGLIHASDLFERLQYGKTMRAYIKTIRPDGKLDVVLKKPGQAIRHDLAQRILSELHKREGYLALHDKSPSEEINRIFGESKKSFKNAIGHLYKQGKIVIESNGIRLRTDTNTSIEHD